MQDYRVVRLSGYLPLAKQMIWEAPSPTCEAEETKEFPMLYYCFITRWYSSLLD
jgi:hypothetical protein